MNSTNYRIHFLQFSKTYLECYLKKKKRWGYKITRKKIHTFHTCLFKISIFVGNFAAYIKKTCRERQGISNSFNLFIKITISSNSFHNNSKVSSWVFISFVWHNPSRSKNNKWWSSGVTGVNKEKGVFIAQLVTSRNARSVRDNQDRIHLAIVTPGAWFLTLASPSFSSSPPHDQ